MNNPQSLRSLILAVITLACGGISISAQSLRAEEVRTIKARAANPVTVSFFTVTQEFEGSFESIGTSLAEFRKNFEAQKIRTSRNPTPIVIYFESPEGKSSFRYAVGFKLPRRVEVKEPLKGEMMSFPKAVRHLHVGPPEQLGEVHAVIRRSLPKKAATAAVQPDTKFPVVVEIPDDPAKVRKDRFRQTMIVPIG